MGRNPLFPSFPTIFFEEEEETRHTRQLFPINVSLSLTRHARQINTRKCWVRCEKIVLLLLLLLPDAVWLLAPNFESTSAIFMAPSHKTTIIIVVVVVVVK